MQVVKECGLAKAETGLFGRSAAETLREESAVNRLSKDLSIAPARKANVISITYASKSPELSDSVLQKHGDHYQEKHLTLNPPTVATDLFRDQSDEDESPLR